MRGRRLHHPALEAPPWGRPDDQRQSHQFLVQMAVSRGRGMPHLAALEVFFAVIGGQHDDGSVQPAAGLQKGPQVGEPGIELPEAGQIERADCRSVGSLESDRACGDYRLRHHLLQSLDGPRVAGRQ